MSLKEEVAKLEGRLREARRAVEVAQQDADAETLSVLQWCEDEKARATRGVTDTVGALAKTYAAMVKNLERARESRIKAANEVFEEDRRKVQDEKTRVMKDAEADLIKQRTGIELEAQKRMEAEKVKAQALLAPLLAEVQRLEAKLAEKTNKPPLGADPVGPAIDPASAETPVDGSEVTPPNGTPISGPAGHA